MVLYWDGIIWSTLLGALFNVAQEVSFAWRLRGTPQLNLPIVFGAGLGGLIAQPVPCMAVCTLDVCLHKEISLVVYLECRLRHLRTARISNTSIHNAHQERAHFIYG